MSLYLSKQVGDAAVVQHRTSSVSAQAVAAGRSGTLIKPVPKEKPESHKHLSKMAS